MKTILIFLNVIFCFSFVLKNEFKLSFPTGIYLKKNDEYFHKAILIFSDAKTVVFAMKKKDSKNWRFDRWETLYWDSGDLIFRNKPFDFEKGVFYELDTVVIKKNVESRFPNTNGTYRFRWHSDEISFSDYSSREEFNEKKNVKSNNYYSFVSRIDSSWTLNSTVLSEKLNLIFQNNK